VGVALESLLTGPEDRLVLEAMAGTNLRMSNPPRIRVVGPGGSLCAGAGADVRLKRARAPLRET
jgi:hypothetical protein